MLKNQKEAIKVLANLVGEASLAGRSASALTADIHEDRAGLVVPELVVTPISLGEVRLIFKIEMIKLLGEVLSKEVLLSHLHILLCHPAKNHGGASEQGDCFSHIIILDMDL